MDENRNFFEEPPRKDGYDANGFKKPGNLDGSHIHINDNLHDENRFTEDGTYRMSSSDSENMKEKIFDNIKRETDFNTSGEDYVNEFETIHSHETAPPPEFYNTKIKKKKRIQKQIP